MLHKTNINLTLIHNFPLSLGTYNTQGFQILLNNSIFSNFKVSLMFACLK